LRGNLGVARACHNSRAIGLCANGESKLLRDDEDESAGKGLQPPYAEVAARSPMLCYLHQLSGSVSAKSALAQFLAVAGMDTGVNFFGRE
jgi:hypothetical protein